ncbi:MAG: ABC transporter ATP-binding protein [Bryobacteraceae bacterium]
MPPDVIRTEGLSKDFGKRAAVQSVSLTVERGSVYAFLGPNGAGKSTTIRMLLGLLRPTAGSVSLFGLGLSGHRREILEQTGSLVESPSVYPHLTARENLEVARCILDAPKGDIDRVVEIVGLGNASRNLVKTYSLGMKQRLGLALAMLGKRELLILDEPTNGLDPAGMNEMRSLIRRLPEQHGITVFLSSHLLNEVEQVATHVGILSQGRVVFQGSAAELRRLRRPRLRIRVDEALKATVLLATRGWKVEQSDGWLLAPDGDDPAEINRALVEAGFSVRHLAVESASLEDVFLEMTRAEIQ